MVHGYLTDSDQKQQHRDQFDDREYREYSITVVFLPSLSLWYNYTAFIWI